MVKSWACISHLRLQFFLLFMFYILVIFNSYSHAVEHHKLQELNIQLVTHVFCCVFVATQDILQSQWQIQQANKLLFCLFFFFW